VHIVYGNKEESKNMSTEKKTLGQAIDEIVTALSALDEKARATAIAAACTHLGLDWPSERQPPPLTARATATQAQTPEHKPARTVDIRIMKEEKNPETAIEMACLVAYYLQEQAPPAERRDVVTIEDMKKYFKQAHSPLPKRIEPLLVSGRHSGYFDLVERSKYRLNAVGYNLAAHGLPRNLKAEA
jgi:hypothetical protein